VRLGKHSEERSSQTTGTKSLNQSCQPSMAMGKVSMALRGVKFLHGAFFLLFVASYHSTTVSLGPPDFSAHTLSAFETTQTTIAPPLPLCFFPPCPGTEASPGDPPKTKMPIPVIIDSLHPRELSLPILATPANTPAALSPPCVPQNWRIRLSRPKPPCAYQRRRPRPPLCILHRCHFIPRPSLRGQRYLKATTWIKGRHRLHFSMQGNLLLRNQAQAWGTRQGRPQRLASQVPLSPISSLIVGKVAALLRRKSLPAGKF
jgi:hypothetical protein